MRNEVFNTYVQMLTDRGTPSSKARSYATGLSDAELLSQLMMEVRRADPKPSNDNWFNTLGEALDSEGLIELWADFPSINYGDTATQTVEDGPMLRYISIYRNERGRYERPVHYVCGKR